jgi:hypothetical protein
MTSVSAACLKCPICIDDFKHPIILPCGHSYCKQCITEVFQNPARKRCPLCQAPCAEVYTFADNFSLKEAQDELRRYANIEAIKKEYEARFNTELEAQKRVLQGNFQQAVTTAQKEIREQMAATEARRMEETRNTFQAAQLAWNAEKSDLLQRNKDLQASIDALTTEADMCRRKAVEYAVC